MNVSAVFLNFLLNEKIQDFQDGTTYKKWKDGDKAVIRGHLELLRLKQHESTLVYTHRALCHAVETGRMEMVDHILAQHTNKKILVELYKQEALERAVCNGHLHIVAHLSNMCSHADGVVLMNAAAANGHLHVLEWLDWNYPEDSCTGQGIVEAASHGHLSVLVWLQERHPEGACPPPLRINAAAGSGNLALVEWLFFVCGEECTTDAMDRAAANGHLHVLEWLHTYSLQGCTSRAMNGAAAAGHLDVVKWLHKRYPHIGGTEMALYGATCNGHLDTVIWLHNNRNDGCAFGALDQAAANGHLHVIQWFYQERQERVTIWALDAARKTKQIHVLKWLDENANNLEIYW